LYLLAAELENGVTFVEESFERRGRLGTELMPVLFGVIGDSRAGVNR
jgi:hypothetical protein